MEKKRKSTTKRKSIDVAKGLRAELVRLMSASDAYAPMDDILRDWPPALRGVTLPGLPYSAWQLLEHVRIAQWDILEFSRNPDHVSPNFPDGYWPQTQAPPSKSAWGKSVAQIRGDLRQMCELVNDPSVDLLAPIPHASPATLLREAMLIAKHNSYHLGQLVLLRRLLGAKPLSKAVGPYTAPVIRLRWQRHPPR